MARGGITDELRISRYIKITTPRNWIHSISGNLGELRGGTPENTAAWRSAYRETDGVDYDGILSLNPLYKWWRFRGSGQQTRGVFVNQIDPRTGTVHRGGPARTHNIGDCVSLLQSILARYTALTGLIRIPVPRHNNAWWFELLSLEWQQCVIAIESMKLKPNRPQSKAAFEQLAPFIYVINATVHDDFLVTMRDTTNSKTHSFYVLPFLLATGVEMECIPERHRTLPPIADLIQRIKAKHDLYKPKDYIDVLFRCQAKLVTIAREHMDIIDQFYNADHSNPAYVGFKQWLKVLDRLDVYIIECDVDHVGSTGRLLKKEYGNPSTSTAGQLMYQFVRGGLQLLQKDDHKMKDSSKIARIVSGHIPNIGIDGPQRSQRELAKYVQAHHISVALYGRLCGWGSGLERALENEPQVVHHHPTGEKDLTGIDRDGFEHLFTTTKKISNVSDIVNITSTSQEAYEDDLEHELSNSRPGRHSYHDLYHYLITHPTLLEILGIRVPYIVDGEFVVRLEWQDDLPPMVEEGVTRVESERRLADFLETKEPLSMSYFDNLCVQYIAADSDDDGSSDDDENSDGSNDDDENSDGSSDDEPWP